VHMVRKRIQLRQAAGSGASGIMHTPTGAPP
jgi:hypothetical protein